MCGTTVSCPVCSQTKKINILKKLTFASWFIHSCVKSGTPPAGPVRGTSQTKAAGKAQIRERPTHSRVPVTGELPSLFSESKDFGVAPGFSVWVCEIVKQQEPARCWQFLRYYSTC